VDVDTEISSPPDDEDTHVSLAARVRFDDELDSIAQQMADPAFSVSSTAPLKVWRNPIGLSMTPTSRAKSSR
jgi:hypothetical protein